MTQVFQEQFARTRGSGSPTWLTALRESGMARFTEVGFPTLHDEDWRFTDIGPIAKAAFTAANAGAAVSPGAIAPFTFGANEGVRLTFVDGHFVPGLSLRPARLAGVTVAPLSEIIDTPAGAALLAQRLGHLTPVEMTPFVALNAALFSDGAAVHVAAGVADAPTIHLLFVSSGAAAGTMAHLRNVLVVERGASARVVEHYVSLSDGEYLVNAATEVELGDNAELTHYQVQRQGAGAFQLAAIHARQGRDSRYHGFSAAIGGRIGRNDTRTVFAGPGGECTLNGLYLARADQLIDNHTAIEHREPNCGSRQLYKGVLSGRAHAVFNGKVLVTPEAQKTDGKQTNRNLILSDHARVDTKPQLEIFADDVKCTHGATVGRLEELPLFYLESRGIGPVLGQKILTYAFAAEMLTSLTIDPVRAQLEALVGAWLE
ncbi:MAG TPA: Fe-S cluster assembly protein SufD [Gemmatimonadales bacterium]|nr:Fe-S cluster assembly protein SufD [Gemmatimonadales bacterium]